MGGEKGMEEERKSIAKCRGRRRKVKLINGFLKLSEIVQASTHDLYIYY